MINNTRAILWLTTMCFVSFNGYSKTHESAYDDNNRFANSRDPFLKPEVAENIDVSIDHDSKEPVSFLPLVTELIEIKYADAMVVAELLNREQTRGMLSEHGSISYDERTNVVIVKEQPEYVSAMKALVKELDIPVKQVQIEARIAIVNEGSIEELGVRWALSASGNNWALGGSIEGNRGEMRGDSRYQDRLPSHFDDGSTHLDDYLNINLGSSAPNASSIAFQVGKVGSSALLDLELSALQSESKADVVSSPRLITTNKKPAYIEQGTEIPYLEASESGVATVRFRKAVLSLEVTPQITPDNELILDLLVTQDRPGQMVKTGTGEAIAIDTQRISTQVLASNGETVVLGGIYQHTKISAVDKVPILGELPFIGWLFRRDYENQEKRELLIFVTPQVVI